MFSSCYPRRPVARSSPVATASCGLAGVPRVHAGRAQGVAATHMSCMSAWLGRAFLLLNYKRRPQAGATAARCWITRGGAVQDGQALSQRDDASRQDVFCTTDLAWMQAPVTNAVLTHKRRVYTTQSTKRSRSTVAQRGDQP